MERKEFDKPIQMVKILPDHPVTHKKDPKSIFSDDPELVKEFSRTLPERDEASFGLLKSGNKAVDMDALTKRIRTKGSKPFQRALTEVFAEMPPGFENGTLLTHAQVCRMFDVTSMTIYSWRKRFGLPSIELTGGRKPPVRYDEGVVLKWAEMHGKKVMKHDYMEWQ